MLTRDLCVLFALAVWQIWTILLVAQADGHPLLWYATAILLYTSFRARSAARVWWHGSMSLVLVVVGAYGVGSMWGHEDALTLACGIFVVVHAGEAISSAHGGAGDVYDAVRVAEEAES